MKLNYKCGIDQALAVLGRPDLSDLPNVNFSKALRLAGDMIPQAHLAEFELEPFDWNIPSDRSEFLLTAAIHVRTPWSRKKPRPESLFWVAGLPYTQFCGEPGKVKSLGNALCALLLSKAVCRYEDKPSPDEQSYYQMHHHGPIFRILEEKGAAPELKPIRRYHLHSFRLSKAGSPLPAAREIEIRFSIQGREDGEPQVIIHAASEPKNRDLLRDFAVRAAKLSRTAFVVRHGDLTCTEENISEIVWARDIALDFAERYIASGGVEQSDSFRIHLRSAIDMLYGRGVVHPTPLAILGIAVAHDLSECDTERARVGIETALDLRVGAEALPVAFSTKPDQIRHIMKTMYENRPNKEALTRHTKVLVALNKASAAKEPVNLL